MLINFGNGAGAITGSAVAPSAGGTFAGGASGISAQLFRKFRISAASLITKRASQTRPFLFLLPQSSTGQSSSTLYKSCTYGLSRYKASQRLLLPASFWPMKAVIALISIQSVDF